MHPALVFLIGLNLFGAVVAFYRSHELFNYFGWPAKVMAQVSVKEKNIHQVLTKAGVTWMVIAGLISFVLFKLTGWMTDLARSTGNDELYGTLAFTFGLWGVVILVVTLMNYSGMATVTRKKYDDIQKKDTLKTAYGVKEWATIPEIDERLSKYEADGLDTGIHIGIGIHWNEKGHMLCVGGSGQGKGVNLVLPALLSDGLVAAGVSVVCLDPKGENAAVAAPNLIARGYDVHIVNPFGIQELNNFGNSFWNPFTLIDPKSDNANKLYDVLAMSIHNRKGQGDNSFFDNRCRQYISLYLSYAHHVEKPDFDMLYDWVTFSGDRRKELLSGMATDESFEGANTAAAILDRLTGESAKTEENIYGTVEEAMNIFKDKALRRSLSGSDFDMREIAKKPTAIFVCIPFEELGYYSAWVRMFFNFLLRTLTRHYDVNRKVLVLLDEFAQLSYMDEIIQSSTVLRGYNVTLWPIVQSLGQLKDIYKEKWEIFINTAVVKHWLSSGADNTTADYISHRMPQALKFIGNNADGSPKEIQTKLLDPNQVMSFKNMICEISGLESPIRFAKTPYWELKYSKDNASPNPFYD